MLFNGNPGAYLYKESVSAYPSGDLPVTLEAWVQRAPGFTSGDFVGYGANSYSGSRVALGEGSPTNISMEFENEGINGSISPNNFWHHIVGVYGGGALSSTVDQIFVDGVPISTTMGGGTPSISTTGFKIGGIPTVAYCCALNGSVDEIRVSSGVRSADWVATEYNNESSPSSFYAVTPENTIVISPGGATLSGSENEQFTVSESGVCSQSVTWCINPVGVGTITTGGLHTAPSVIEAPQTVTITATSQLDASRNGAAIINLIGANPQLSLAAVSQAPYSTGTAQGFVATVKSPVGLPAAGVPVNFTVVGQNTTAGIGTTDANGVASFVYVGAKRGIDTVNASASVNDETGVSNELSVSWIAPVPATGEGSISLLAQPSIGLEGLLGAFTDSEGAVIEPLAIGAKPGVFVVPPGATRLQFGVDDDYLADNLGPGFVVNVNDVAVTVPAGALPGLWVAGGLNSAYAFGVQDGTNPAVAPIELIPGQSVVVAYQSGLNSPGGAFPAIYDANGVPTLIAGTAVGSSGTFAPTFFISSASYPVGQPVSVSAVVTNGAGAPMSNVPVILRITGANARQLQATTDSSGTAASTYNGLFAGTDFLSAEAISLGEATFVSSQTTVTWVNATNLPTGSLTLSPSSVQPQPLGVQEAFTVFAADSFGSPLSGLYVGLVVSGADQMLLAGTTDSTGHATVLYRNLNPGTASVQAVAVINNLDTMSNIVSVPWTLPASTTSTSGGSGTLSIGISARNTVILPSTLQLNRTATDSALPAGSTITTTWSEVSGPGTATFANPQQAATTRPSASLADRCCNWPRAT